jgi:hypothetical protein
MVSGDAKVKHIIIGRGKRKDGKREINGGTRA